MQNIENMDPNSVQDPTLRQAIIEAKARLTGQPAFPKTTDAVSQPKVEQEGMQGFGKVNKEILQNAAGGFDDKVALNLMNSGGEGLAGGSGLVGKKSPWAGVADAVKTGIGTYGMLNTIKSKRDSAGAIGDILSPKQKSKALRDANDFPLSADGELSPSCSRLRSDTAYRLTSHAT